MKLYSIYKESGCQKQYFIFDLATNTNMQLFFESICDVIMY